MCRDANNPRHRFFGSKKRKRQQKKRQEEENFHRDRRKKLMRMRNLHPAAQWKRVLSATDFWFSDVNLKEDIFLRETLYKHHGWIPVSVLLTFPKFQYWTNAQLLVDAYSSSAAKRFQVMYSRKLCESPPPRPKQQRSLQFSMSNDDYFDDDFPVQSHYDHLQADPHFFQDSGYADGVGDEGFDFAEYADYADIDFYNDCSDDERGEEGSVDEHDSSGMHDRVSNDSQGNLTEKGGKERASDEPALQPATSSGSISTLIAQRKEDAPTDLSHDDVIVTPQTTVEEEDRLYDWGNVPDEEDEILADTKSGTYLTETAARGTSARHDDRGGLVHDSEAGVTKIHHGSPAPVFFDVKLLADDVPDIQYALVRHKRISLDHLDSIESGRLSDEDDGNGTEDTDSSDEDTPKETPKPPPKVKKHPLYTTNRPVQVVKTPTKLKAFCSRLESSVRNYAEQAADGKNTNACAIGLDVEYCTLEMDIRGNLPALLQIASPDPQGPVGLIWIDKFPDHGRTMLRERTYDCLIKLLADPTILKVGVGVTKDAKHLADWWGLTKADTKHVHNFFAGFMEIPDEANGSLATKSLHDLCTEQLELTLSKRKEKMSGKNVRRKRQGRSVPTSHWRAKEMTKEMKEYAANDAACSVDVWKKIHGL